ncbi:hypothetical protein [Thermococcus sp. JCM 11816]|uniref:hypothetical protein n=1 Tax=Thermococcus sp. (strain JCM 11816 / KS-1) TaxID=1295125 RepID=UPI000A53C5B8
MIVLPMEGKATPTLRLQTAGGAPYKGQDKLQGGLEVPVLLDGIELKRRGGTLYLPFGVRKGGDVEVAYATATLVMWEGDVLTFRNHLSGHSEIALKGGLNPSRSVGGAK